MKLDIVKFIPSDMRLKITQEFIKEKGIRPLAREVDVNPKSVYKYKEGSSCPGDEVMEKILASIKKEDSELFEKNMGLLRDEFSSAVNEAMEVEEVLTSGKKAEVSVDQEETERGVVGPEETETTGEEAGGHEPSGEKLSVEKICDKIGVKSPFNRSKVQKILNALDEIQEPGVGDLVEETSLSEDAIEKYLEMLENEDFLEEVESGIYILLTGIEGN